MFSKLLEHSITVAFAVAGWIKYLQEKKGAVVGGGGPDAHSDNEELGATPAASDDDGRE